MRQGADDYLVNHYSRCKHPARQSQRALHVKRLEQEVENYRAFEELSLTKSATREALRQIERSYDHTLEVLAQPSIAGQSDAGHSGAYFLLYRDCQLMARWRVR